MAARVAMVRVSVPDGVEPCGCGRGSHVDVAVDAFIESGRDGVPADTVKMVLTPARITCAGCGAPRG